MSRKKQPGAKQDQYRAREAGSKESPRAKAGEISAKQVRYDDTLAASILERMAGGESLRNICRDRAMPAFSTVMRWLSEKPDLQAAYMVAMDCRAQSMADEMLEIADTAIPGKRIKMLPDGSKEVVICDQVERSKLQVHARQWTIARLSPKRYGNRVLNEVSGPDAGPLQISGHSLPTSEQVANFSQEFIEGWASYVHEQTGQSVRFDEQAGRSLSSALGLFAAGKVSQNSSPHDTGRLCAKIQAIRCGISHEQAADSSEQQ